MTDPQSAAATLVDVIQLLATADHTGAVWSHTSSDLNVNLVVIDPSSPVLTHTNNEVDVVVTFISGSGVVEADGQAFAVSAPQAIIIPKGAARSIRCDAGRLAYLTTHLRRAGMWPRVTGVGEPAGTTPRDR